LKGEKKDDAALLTLVDGSVELKHQLKDYKFRGEELESMSFLDFMLETYELTRENKGSKVLDEASSDVFAQSRGPGRPASTRIPYQDGAGRGNKNWII
jgi:hypothetical protein